MSEYLKAAAPSIVAAIALIFYLNSSSVEDISCKGLRGTEQCEWAVIQRLENTGSMHLSIKYEGNGVFTGYATKIGSGPTFQWQLATDCDCEIINAGAKLIR